MHNYSFWWCSWNFLILAICWLLISLTWKFCFISLRNTVKHEWNGIYTIRLKLSRFYLSSEGSHKLSHCQAFKVDWVRKQTPWGILDKNNIFIDGYNRILQPDDISLSLSLKDSQSRAILNFFLAFSCFSEENSFFLTELYIFSRLSLSFSTVTNWTIPLLFIFYFPNTKFSSF